MSNKQIGRRTGLPLRGVMSQSPHAASPSRTETRLAVAVFAACLAFHFWGVGIGWESKNLAGVEFRQTQTAISALFIKQENNFSLAYPTPVLGKPWSIPMEFPLYQWTVVVVGKLTGLGLTKAGRAVSMACFYLMLPAIFLLLARWRVAPGRRWLVLAVVVTCPLYIFYGRAFLIETMALMFGLWFWVAFERAVAKCHWGWLMVAIVAGAGCGLVKVTTFLLYLLPVGAWSLGRLWVARRGNWKIQLVWVLAILAPPLAATLWWLHFTDAVKALNPLAYFLDSHALRDWTLGTMETRFSIESWRLKGALIRDSLTSMPGLAAVSLVFLLAGRRRWREISLCLALFGAPLAIFPVLYAYHEYYYVANTVLLLLAVGLVLVAVVEARRSVWLTTLVVGCVLVAQAVKYLERYFPEQAATGSAESGLPAVLNAFTQRHDVIVMTGDDWSSVTPYFAQRRAIMLLQEMERNHALIEKGLQALAGEQIGALVIGGPPGDQSWLIERLALLGLERTPLLKWRHVALFFRASRRAEILHRLAAEEYADVVLAPGVSPPPEQTLTGWHELRQLSARQRALFRDMNPAPARVYTDFPPWAETTGGGGKFGAHPITRLVFSLPAGRHLLSSSLSMPLAAYRLDLPEGTTSDGVEVKLMALGPDGEIRRLFFTRQFDPRHRQRDRGAAVPFWVEFELPVAGEVELFFGPGPAGQFNRDWISLGPLTID